ncbi:hypothetical protein SUNI508_06167 [Seiridium unicorne]|uniref:RING-type domain-containing protein n=1 Tax=Seiridium unicorne TaxID=138068 RepID=A0ABR2V280_9PEZI
MDPQAMDFVMHRSLPPSNRGALSPMPVDHQPSPCPALRAAAEQNPLPGLHSHSRGGSGSHYDPVHNSMGSGNWWHHNPHEGWQHPSYTPPHMLSRQMPMYSHAPPFAGPPGLIPPMGGSPVSSQAVPPFGLAGVLGDHHGAHGHPHSHTQSPPRFSQRPTIPSLDRMGNAAPNQHGQNSFGGYLGGPNSTEHASRANRLPAIAQISPNFSESANREHASSTRADPSPSQSRTPERQTTTRSSVATVTMPPMRQRAAESGLEGSRAVIGSARNRHRVAATNSESPSDEDSDQNETEMITARMLDVIAAGGASEGGLRAAQLLRGATGGRKVASRKAIAALESVEISDLPESERTCIICYNDFGAETPEGINEAPLRLPKCQHVFGDHCIKKWFAESDSCPYCRDKLPSEPQHRHPHPEAVIQLMRQHVFRQQARDSNPREALDEAGWGTSDSFSGATHRRPDALPSFRSWGPSERRSPPSDTGENRRRIRPRHASLRGTPPSGRSNQFATPAAGLPSGQYHSGGSRYYPSNHTHRHSIGALGSPMPPRLSEAAAGLEHSMPPFLGHASMFQPHEPRLPYPNPLASNEMDLRTGWPPMRPDFYPPMPSTAGGQDVRMADSDSTAGVNSSGHASPR